MKQIINFGFAAIGILAMFMLAIGAYQYLMSAGNIGSAESAKSTIGSALGGLALGLCAWLILNTINPDLVSMKDPSGLNCKATTTTTTQNGTANTANKTYSNVAVNGTTKQRIEQYNAIIKEASQKYNVPENVIKAVIDQESSGKANAGSSAGARGLMQLMPDTARGLGVTDITDPSQNIMAGTKFFSQMYSKYGNVEDALGAYNCGPGRYNQYLNGTRALPKETQRYIPSVMGKTQSY
jgi:soluble lytic murein transglycosylase-like protein